MEKTIECKSQEGVIIGLIDGIIAAATALIPLINENRTFFIEGSPVYEALKDLHEDEDVFGLLKIGPHNSRVYTEENEKIMKAIEASAKLLKEKGILKY